MKDNDIHIIGIQEGEAEQGIENLFEKVMTENFPNLEKKKVMQVQEAQKVPIKMNTKTPTPRHITIKMAKFKHEWNILKAARDKQIITYKGALIRLAADFSTETLHARRKRQETFQGMKSKGLQPRLLYSARLSIKIEGQIKSFPDKRSLKQYTSTKLTLKVMPKEPL